MPATSVHLIGAAFALVLLTFAVGGTMLVTRLGEMRRKHIGMQSLSSSKEMAVRLENVRPADNFRNLFETPVLFYALVATAVAVGPAPVWLVNCAWLYVALRVAHSVVHCTYNTVAHRFVTFASSLLLLVGMWTAYFISLAAAA